MESEGNGLSRRTFLRRTGAGVSGVFACSSVIRPQSSGAGSLSDTVPVVVVRKSSVINNAEIDQASLQIMMDAGIRTLTGIANTGKAWLSLFPGLTGTSVISIKVNCINSLLSSHPATAYCIANGLTSMTVDGKPFPPENIIIWDRTNGELRRAGYSINTGTTGVKCFGTDQSGVGYSPTTYTVAGSSQRLSSILTDQSDYLINLSVLKDHGTAGATFSLKNHFGTCNNPGSLHGGRCNPFIPALNSLAPIRSKQVVCICDALWGIISGGPGGAPQIEPRTLVMSRDPVAHDYVCLQILSDYGWKTGHADHITTAAGTPYSLGVNDPAGIDRITVDEPTVDVAEEPPGPVIPRAVRLFQNYPNPFNGQTAISYRLFQPCRVRLEVFTIQGTLVRRLVDEHQSSGYYRVSWDSRTSRGQTVSSGVYLAVLDIGGERAAIRMHFVK